MVDIGFFRKKSSKEEGLKLDDSLIREGKLDIPSPPSPTGAGGLEFPDHPSYSDSEEKIVLPPVEEEKPEPLPIDSMNGLDPSWADFLKQSQESEEDIKQAAPQEAQQPMALGGEEESNPEREDFGMDVSEALTAKPMPSTPRPQPKLEAPAAQVGSTAPRPESVFEPKKPIFIEAETFSGFLEEIGRVRVKLQLIESVITRIDALQEKEDIELRKWHQGMDEMRRKFLFIDDVLFGG